METQGTHDGKIQGMAQEPMMPSPCIISRVRRELSDTITLEIAPEDSRTRFTFAPGQFNMLYAFGVGEVPISISGDPAGKDKLVHTIRIVGAVTKTLASLKAGDSLGVRGPYGNGWPVNVAEGTDVVIVAGGIGLAPLRPVVYHVLNNRNLYKRLILLYGARRPEEILYHKEMEKWRSRFDLDVFPTVDHATGSWYGNVGVVTTLIDRIRVDSGNCTAFVCGPEIMMRFTTMALEGLGLDDEHIYVSMERNMKCGIGLCGHCQIGSIFVCKDGPVFRLDRIRSILTKREM